ncbi:MAG: FtsX-like permease family protein [Acidimicrobiales bacterium]|nr:FtsX-like permease family protein [Acidimicrobiales bacterium]
MIVLALLIIATLVVIAVRNPLVRRVGLRNAVRRPREALLVVLGCSLGTALIVGSASVGTSYTASLRDQALGELGPLDALVSYENATDWSAASARLNATPSDNFAFTAAVASLGVPITSDTSDATAPDALLVEADYRRLGAMLGDLPPNGPAPGTAWAAPALTTQLNLRLNAALELHGPTTLRLNVSRLTDGPLARFVESPLNRGQNLLVPPGTIAKLQAASEQPLGVHYLSFVGVKGAHDSAPDAVAVAAMERELNARVSAQNGRVTAVRADRMSAAIEAGKANSQFLTTIGFFGILSGALLLVNVLLMLAEERLAELGTLRAVGLSRRPLVQAFTLEGALYAIVGAIVGGGFGALLGRLMVSLAAQASTSSTRNSFELHFSLSRSGLVSGIAAGFVLAVLVVLGTSYRISRLDVIRSIRGLPDPPRERRSSAAAGLVALTLIGMSLAFYGYVNEKAVPLAFGPPMVLTAIGILLSRRWGRVAGLTVACGGNVAWATAFTVLNRDPDTPPVVTVVAGVIAVLSGVLLVNAHQATAAHAIRRIGNGRRTVTSRLGLANPLAHRVRTLLTVCPFALVVFTLAYAEGLASLITNELDKIAPKVIGGYDVYARSSAVNPFDFATLEDPNVAKIARTSTIVTSFAGRGSDQSFWSLTSFDRSFTDVALPPLVERGDRYKTDGAAYRAVLSDPDLVIVPGNFLFRGTTGRSRGEPEGPPRIGDVYTMYNPSTGASRDLTIAGIGQTDVLGNGAYYGYTHAKAFFGDQLVRNSAFFATTGAPSELVRVLNRAGLDNGMKAIVAADEAGEVFANASSTVNLYRADLGVGLVVGVAGVGVVLVRSVRDRRRQIGTLRAMGFESKQIGNSFLLEGVFVAAQGIGVGMGLGMIMTMALSKSLLIKQIVGYYPPVPVPPVSMVVLTVFLLATSLAASYGPARAASRIPPAVALRLVD